MKLQQKLDQAGLVNISFMVVNHQGKRSREKYQLLTSKVTEEIPVYQQDSNKPDVWELLQGNKDDFLIYDSCGKLTHHLQLPFTILTDLYVEYAIRQTYCQEICANCSLVYHPPACSARTVTEEIKTEDDLHSHRNHNHNVQKTRNEEPASHRNLTDDTQLEQGEHEHPQHHHEHPQPHEHPTGLKASEAGTHDSAAASDSQQQQVL